LVGGGGVVVLVCVGWTLKGHQHCIVHVWRCLIWALSNQQGGKVLWRSSRVQWVRRGFLT
jgi:hypothetical protein